MRTGQLYINGRQYGTAGIADSFFLRLRGMLGRDFSCFDALLIRPCSSIHTMLMAYPIDVLFLNSDCEIVKIASNLEPWRTYVGAKNAKSIIELPAGKAEEWNLREGDRISVEGDRQCVKERKQ